MQQSKSQSAAPLSDGSVDCKQWFGTVFTNDKAGMGAVDKDRIKNIVYEMSKDSAHFRNDLRKQSQTEQRVRKMKERASALSPAEIAGHTKAMDMKIAALKASADLTRTWLHIDMDAFFASVEELDDPSLKDQPMAVGGIGMISTANYVARKYGVRSAMPGFIGRRLCPQLVFVKPSFSKYVKVAAATRAILADYDPEFEAGSLDEAYLDVTDYCQMHSTSGEAVAEVIRQRVREEVALTCSCGIGPNRLLAKVASDIRKPDGQFAIPGNTTAITRFIDLLPIRKVPGIGKVSEQVLKAFGIETCAGLIANRGLLSALFSPVSTNFFMAVGLGIGRTQHGEQVEEGAVGRKGMSCERTFQAIGEPAELEAKCTELSEKLAEDLASEGLKGKTITLKLKETNFEVHTRNITLTRHVSSREDIRHEALKLLRAELPITIRLMGIRMSSFLETNTGPGQRTLSAFLKKIGADSATKPAPPQQHGWNQTFLDRETRQALDKQMQQHRLKQESEQQSMNPSPVMGAVSNGHATDATVLAPAACRACEETDVDPKPPDSHADQLGPGKLSVSAAGCSQKSVLQIKNALEPCQAPEAGSSQPLELTLRDWQPGAASQLARSQDASSDPQQHFQQGPQSDLSLLGGHNSRSGPEQQQDIASGSKEIGHSFPGDLTSCRDVLDTADDAGEPDLVHAWDEEPAGIGEMPEEAHQSGSQGAAAKATPGARTWACQVCTFGDNRPQILRCSVCDAVRGTTLDYFMGYNAEVSSTSASQQDAQDSAAKTGSRSKRPGSDAAGNKQKSILGFFAGFEPPAKAAESIALAGSGNCEALGGEQRASNSVQTHQQARSGGMWEEAEGGSWLCKQCSEEVPEKDKSTHEDFHIALDMSRKQPGQAVTKHMQRQGSASMTQTQRKRKVTPSGSRAGAEGVNKRSVKSVAAFLRPTTM